MEATTNETIVKAVRLELAPGDYVRIEACSRRIALSKASYARMAVLERIMRDEEKAEQG